MPALYRTNSLPNLPLISANSCFNLTNCYTLKWQWGGMGSGLQWLKIDPLDSSSASYWTQPFRGRPIMVRVSGASRYQTPGLFLQNCICHIRLLAGTFELFVKSFEMNKYIIYISENLLLNSFKSNPLPSLARSTRTHFQQDLIAAVRACSHFNPLHHVPYSDPTHFMPLRECEKTRKNRNHASVSAKKMTVSCYF